MDGPADDAAGKMAAAPPPPINALTVACIAVVAYLVASVVHEGLGHGLAAVILGARGPRLTTAALHLDSKSVVPEASRIISIAGPLAGLLVGSLLALYHGRTRSGNPTFRYFLWLTAYVCLFANSGYLMALSFVRFGDIHGFVKGLDSPFAWRLVLTVVGTALSVVALFFAVRTLDEFLGRTRRRGRAARLLLISYVAGSVPLILSTLLGEGGAFLALASAAPRRRRGAPSFCPTRRCGWARPGGPRNPSPSHRARACPGALWD
jgi:hypothetical protein